MDCTRWTRPTLGLLLAVAGADHLAAQNRILVILADDLGVEQLALYRPEVRVLAATPAINAIAARGVTFRNAWVNPLCSPTRATIQTGLYACRTGIGHVIEKECSNYSLPIGGELPTLLTGFKTGAFGKWHLEDQTQPDLFAPMTHGYGHFEGTLWGVPYQCGLIPTRPCSPSQLLEGANYYQWSKTTIDAGQRTTKPVTAYLPADAIDSAANWLDTVWDQSSLTYLAMQAPFEQQHCPPAHLQNVVSCNACNRDGRCPAGPFTQDACLKAAIEAFDTKIGDLLRAIELVDPLPWWRTTTIVFLGDNGTGISDTGFWPAGEGKGTLFNGGIHAPLIIAGREVPNVNHGTQTDAIANGVDVYATVLRMAGKQVPAGIDGVSLVPVLQTNQPVRSFIYSERFDQNGPGPHTGHFKAAANATYTYKLRRAGANDYFYRLAPSPSEPNGPKQETLICFGPACASLPPAQAAEYLQLKAYLDSICP